MTLIDLGWCMARLELKRSGRDDPRLTIVSPSCADSPMYEPAESVTIYGQAGLLALRDALNEAFPPEHVPPAL